MSTNSTDTPSARHARWAARLTAGMIASAGLALVAALALAAPAAHAAPLAPTAPFHASYVSSDPAANAVVKTAPSVVTIHFAEPVNPADSAITVYDAKGQAVSQAAQVDTNDLKTMHVAMAGDDSEVYLVYWRTVSATDGDPDVGAFNFFVNASGSSDLAPTGTATTSAAAPTSGSSASGVPLWMTALIAALALLVGLGGGVAWARNRSSVARR